MDLTVYQPFSISEGNDMRRITIQKACGIYWNKYASMKKSYKSYKAALNNICEVWDGKYIDDIKVEDVIRLKMTWRNKVISKSGKKMSETTINRYQTILIHLYNRFFRWVDKGEVRCKLPVENPASPVDQDDRKLIKKVNEDDYSRNRVLDKEEFQRFNMCCDEDLQKINNVAVLTMLRRKDLMNLTKDSINNSTNCLEGVQAKTGKRFSVPITPMLRAVLNTCKGYHLLNFRNFRRRFEEARDRSGINFRFQDFRRTGARKMLESGTDIDTVKERLGHSSLTMTQRYVPSAKKDQINAGLKLENSFFKVA